MPCQGSALMWLQAEGVAISSPLTGEGKGEGALRGV